MNTSTNTLEMSTAKTMTKMKQKLLEDEYTDLMWTQGADADAKAARLAEIEALLDGCECLLDEEVEALETARRLHEEFYVKRLGETEGKLCAAKVWAELAEQEDEE